MPSRPGRSAVCLFRCNRLAKTALSCTPGLLLLQLIAFVLVFCCPRDPVALLPASFAVIGSRRLLCPAHLVAFVLVFCCLFLFFQCPNFLQDDDCICAYSFIFSLGLSPDQTSSAVAHRHSLLHVPQWYWLCLPHPRAVLWFLCKRFLIHLVTMFPK